MARSYDDHVVLGAGGAIGHALVPELLRNRQSVTLVSRSGRSVEGTRSVTADVLNYETLEAAVPEGSAVYLLVGLPYRAAVWEEVWPRVMRNVIRVCSEKHALLVFFDNVYMYGPVDGPMTEQTPHNPKSRKGAVRAEIVEALDREVSAGSLEAIVARSADFYGPGAEANGVPNLLILEKLLKRPAGPVAGGRRCGAQSDLYDRLWPRDSASRSRRDELQPGLAHADRHAAAYNPAVHGDCRPDDRREAKAQRPAAVDAASRGYLRQDDS